VQVGCGDNRSDVTCGDGTTLVDGVCTSDGGTNCGAGTVAMNGQCVPDGSMICEQGTVYDPAMGGCVLDPTACAEGTVLLDGQCVADDDALTADLDEAAEPNGPGGATPAGSFPAPAIDASTTLHGCVRPVDEDADGALDADLDVWTVTATEPMVLEITADGVGGLVAGYVMVSGGGALSPLLDNWQRFGLNLTGDTAKRQVYLPAAGTYGLIMADGRQLFFGEAAGDPTADQTCYYTTVKRVALPAAETVTLPQTLGADQGNVRVLRYTADAVGDIVDATMNTATAAGSPAYVLLRNTTPVQSVIPNGGLTFSTTGGLNSGDTVSFVVDWEYNYAIQPQDYTLDFFDIGGQALPTAGTPLVVTEHNGTNPAAPYADLNYLYFDVARAGQILHFGVSSTTAIDMVVVGRDIFTPAGAFDTVAQFNTFGGAGTTAITGQYVRFPTAGRYYLVTQNPAATMAGGMYTVTSTLTDMAIGPLTYGTAVTAQALSAQGASFHSVDLTSPIWTRLAAAGANWGAGNIRIETYDLAGSGWLNNNYPVVFTSNQAPTAGVPASRILAGETRDFLVKVSSTAAPGAGATYDLNIGDETFTNLGTLAAGASTFTATNLAAGGVQRYFGRSAAGNLFSGTATPSDNTVDISVERRARDGSAAQTVNAGGAGVAETLSTAFGSAPDDFVAFTVTNRSTTTQTNIAGAINIVTPRPYVATTGTLPIVDACTGTGSTNLGNAFDDEYIPARTLPAGWSFQLFGEAVDRFIIAANGFVKFGNGTIANPTCSFGCFSNGAIPSATEPNGILAPMWNDYDSLTLCVKEEATMVTVQWDGALYLDTPTVLFQVRLHMNGVIDFIYGTGADHTATTTSATVGAENLGGVFGHQYIFNTAVPTAGTSRTLTPM
jgi:hypothetical protein